EQAEQQARQPTQERAAVWKACSDRHPPPPGRLQCRNGRLSWEHLSTYPTWSGREKFGGQAARRQPGAQKCPLIPRPTKPLGRELSVGGVGMALKASPPGMAPGPGLPTPANTPSSRPPPTFALSPTLRDQLCVAES